MARSRNIKPGFFSNEDLVELGFATRLLFAGLWTIADREGRLEDRPKKIKIGVFPADDVDVDGMLQELHNSKFIQRYEVEGAKFIQISAWSKHQNPHHTEKASEIPSSNGEITVKAPLKTGDSRKQDGGNLADSLFTDSLIPDSLMEAKASSWSAKPIDLPACPHQEIIGIFAELLPTLPSPKPELWSGTRAKQLAARWKWVMTAKKTNGDRYATNREEGLAFFRRMFGYVAKSCPHLTGDNDRGWTADLGWLANETNFAKVMQGNYERQEVGQ